MARKKKAAHPRAGGKAEGRQLQRQEQQQGQQQQQSKQQTKQAKRKRKRAAAAVGAAAGAQAGDGERLPSPTVVPPSVLDVRHVVCSSCVVSLVRFMSWADQRVAVAGANAAAGGLGVAGMGHVLPLVPGLTLNSARLRSGAPLLVNSPVWAALPMINVSSDPVSAAMREGWRQQAQSNGYIRHMQDVCVRCVQGTYDQQSQPQQSPGVRQEVERAVAQLLDWWTTTAMMPAAAEASHGEASASAATEAQQPEQDHQGGQESDAKKQKCTPEASQPGESKATNGVHLDAEQAVEPAAHAEPAAPAEPAELAEPVRTVEPSAVPPAEPPAAKLGAGNVGCVVGGGLASAALFVSRLTTVEPKQQRLEPCVMHHHPLLSQPDDAEYLPVVLQQHPQELHGTMRAVLPQLDSDLLADTVLASAVAQPEPPASTLLFFDRCRLPTGTHRPHMLEVPTRWRKAIEQLQAAAIKSHRSTKSPMQLSKPFRVAVVGAQGAGKSTFLRLLLNMLLDGAGIPTAADDDGEQFVEAPPAATAAAAAGASATIVSEPEGTAATATATITATTAHKFRFVEESFSDVPHVAFFDGDLGQPEYTVPGMVSVHQLSGPASSLPFAHLRHPEFAAFVGDTSPKNEPQGYINAVSRACGYIEEHLPQVPIVINTDGWVRSMGAELHGAVLDVVQPTHVVHIKSVARSNAGGSRDPVELPFLSHATRSFQLITIESAVSRPEQEQEAARVPATNLRLLRMVHYFLAGCESVTATVRCGSIQDPAFSIPRAVGAIRPYVVRADDVEIRFMSDMPAPALVLAALNAQMVALVAGTYSGAEPRPDPETGPDLHLTAPRCVGMGLVRAIDVAHRTLFVITPVSLELLQTVTCLVKPSGDMQPPALLVHDPHAHQHPYLSCEATVGVGTTHMRSRTNVRRRGLQQPQQQKKKG